MELSPLLEKFLMRQALILVPVLMLFGSVLKETPILPNWLIPWVLLVLGMLGGLGLVGLSLEGALQGIIAAGVAVFNHQLYRQSIKR